MNTERHIWIDYLRAIACVMVLFLHTSAHYVIHGFNDFNNGINIITWVVGNIFDSASRICVPLFFMISGYFFFYSERVPSFKNTSRILLSLVFYSAISIIVYKYANAVYPEIFKVKKVYWMLKPESYHLWFFYAMFVIYILSFFIKIKTTNNVQSFIAIIFAMILLNDQLPLIVSEIFNINIKNPFIMEGNTIYFLVYALTGAVIRSMHIDNNKKCIAIISSYILLLLSIITIISLTHIKSKSVGGNFLSFYSYTSPMVFICSVSFFIIFKIKSESFKKNNIISLISDNSLAIYGTHALYLFLIQGFYEYHKTNPFVGIFSVVIMLLTFSLATSILIKKIDKKGFIS